MEKWGALDILILKILITGGLGLIGGRLGYFLSNKGHNVTLATRSKDLNIEQSMGPSQLIQIRTIDWNNTKTIESLCESNELIIHSAGMNSHDCLLDPEHAIFSAGYNAAQLIKAAQNSNVEKLIYLSSAHVYSSSLEGLIDESSPTLNEHPYAKAHLSAEKKIIDLDNSRKIKTLVLRLSNCFGYPIFKNNNAWDLVANDLSKQAANSNKLIIKSNRFTQRDFMPIDLFCETLYSLANKSNFFSDRLKIVNFGSGVSLSILSLAQKIQQISEEISGTLPEILFADQNSKELGVKLQYRSKFFKIHKNQFDDAFTQEIKKLFHHFS